MDPFDAGRQPGGRPPAPGRLAYVQAFANTFWDLDAGGADCWPDPPGLARWLARRGFAADPDDRELWERARGLREALRAIAYANHAGRPPGAALGVLDRAAQALDVHVRFAGGTVRHEAPGAGGAASLGLLVATAADALADGSLARLKACPGPHCGWVFYDGSRNRSSHWCSMAVCGNRVKGAAFRARRRGGQATATPRRTP